MVGEGGTVGCVAVSVTVDVGDDDGLLVLVALGVSVKGSGVGEAVADGTGWDVEGGGSVLGLKIKASRMIITIIAGMTYRDQTGNDDFAFRNGVTTGGLSVYPNALRIFAKLS